MNQMWFLISAPMIAKYEMLKLSLEANTVWLCDKWMYQPSDSPWVTIKLSCRTSRTMLAEKVDIFSLSLLFLLFAGPNVLNLAGLKFKFIGEKEKAMTG